jgi:hypothetical protein
MKKAKKIDRSEIAAVPLDVLLDVRFLLEDIIVKGDIEEGFVSRCRNAITALNDEVFHKEDRQCQT